MTDLVRLTIEKIDTTNIAAGPTEVLLDLTETDETVLSRATAWASVQGYTRLIPSLELVFNQPHTDGWAAILNKPHSLAILATWPWCQGPHDLLTLYGMGPQPA